MKLRHLLAAALVLTLPVVVHADTVFFSRPGTSGIKSVSGTIVQETASALQIKTADGRTVTIPASDVFQVIRDAKAEGDSTNVKADPFRVTRETPSLTGFPGSEPDAPRSPHAPHFGVKGGMNLSNLSVDPQDLADTGSLKSYAAGGWCGIPLTPRWTLLTEALYSVKGDAESSGGYTASTHVTYLDVPVLAKMAFRRDATARPSLFLGPLMAFNLAAHSTLTGNGTNVDLDVKDQVRSLDLGVVVGGGVDFPVGGRTYGVELRYSKGLSNAAGESANGTAHNDVIAVLGSISLE
ncbi:MAG: outer membrane beta-barrel protein [bacterium]